MMNEVAQVAAASSPAFDVLNIVKINNGWLVTSGQAHGIDRQFHVSNQQMQVFTDQSALVDYLGSAVSINK